MAIIAPIFFDTSVLIAGLIDLGPAVAPAQRILDAIAQGKIRGPHTAWHCCLEFYSVSTRLPPEFRLAPPDALRLIQDEILARLDVHQLPENAYASFLQTAMHEGVAGGRIYDAHIAEIARLAGVKTVVTDNRRHFIALLRHGIRVLSAGEFAGTLGV